MNCLELPIQVLSYQMDCSLFHLLCNISYMASCYVPQSSQLIVWPDAETPSTNMPTFFSTALTTAVRNALLTALVHEHQMLFLARMTKNVKL